LLHKVLGGFFLGGDQPFASC